MSQTRRWRFIMLLAPLSAALGGCVAAPVAQLASQAIAQRAPMSSPEVAQAPDTAGPMQAMQGLSALLQHSLLQPGGSAGGR